MKKVLLLLFAAISIYASPLPETQPPLSKPLKEDPFFYMKLGGTGFLMGGTADLSLGYRAVKETHALDSNFGFLPLLGGGRFACIGYAQINYLYYPASTRGPYFGVGLQGNVLNLGREMLVFPDLPLTVGCQFSTQRPSFLQLQVFPVVSCFSMLASPLFICGSVNYGFGF